MHPLLVSCLDMPWSLLRATTDCANCAVPVSAVAVVPRRGSKSTIVLRFILMVVRESAVETSAATELRVAVSLLVRTLPMFRTAQTLHNTNKASEQKTDLHRSLGTPHGWTTVQRGWSPPRYCC